MKHIVFVCQVFYPDAMSTSQLFTDLLRRIVSDNVKVSVVCGYPSNIKVTDVPTPRYEQWSGLDIYRCGWKIDLKRNFVFRAFSYIAFLLHAAWQVARLKRKDVVFGVTNPPFLALILWGLSTLVRIPYQYMFLDIYPEGLFPLGKLKPESPITGFWMALNRCAYQKAEKLVVLGRDMIPLLSANYGIEPERFTYIPHWSAADVEHPLPFEDNPLVAARGVQDKFVVQYSGNMGIWHDIETLVEAANKLRSFEHIHFLFIGDGFRRKAAQQRAEQLKLPNISWLGFVPLEELAQSLACCHVALISQRERTHGVAVPCKIYGILASGRAVVAQVPHNSEIAFLVREESCGMVVEPRDAEQLAHTILRLASEPERVASMGNNAFAAYQSKYKVHQAVDAFKKLWDLT